ncbi:hypothetical protein BJV82DRAFT_582980 [Fennellomyces sp. T-0311]|nr:hypothetical protein BJV82DRAFT_582980 [Fennellomyces sp. T-0311]
MYSFMNQELPADAESTNTARGLRHFYISPAEGLATYPYSINEARAYMEANCATLQDFRINVSESEEHPHIPIGGHPSVIFSNLHTIHCFDNRFRENGDCDYSPLMACIINLSPNLERLKVEYFEGLAPIFYALKNADKLQLLELTRISLAKADNAAFQVFLNRQVSRPTIKIITITRSDGITDTCLTRLSSIGTIRELRLYHQDEVTPRLLSSYASMNPSTEKMKIEGLHATIDDNLDLLLQAISQMTFLKSISITFKDKEDSDTIPVAGLRYLLHHSISIRYIQINKSTVKRWCHENAAEAYIIAKMAKAKGITVAGLCTIY